MTEQNRETTEQPRRSMEHRDLSEPVELLSDEQAEQVLGGTILQVNGGGNTPQRVNSNETITIHGARTE